jgi:type IV secretion system protein VirD4
MQLPPTEELVMVSGHAPIRATKLRYHLDRNFTMRVQAPPRLREHRYIDCPSKRPDDWSNGCRFSSELDQSDERPAGPGYSDSFAGELAREPILGGISSDRTDDPRSYDPLLHDEKTFAATVHGPTLASRRAPDTGLQRAARLGAFDPSNDIPL